MMKKGISANLYQMFDSFQLDSTKCASQFKLNRLDTGLLIGCGKKNENCALFWGRIVRDKKLIVRVIVRDCAILRGTKYFVLTRCQSKHRVLLINHTFFVISM